MGKKFLTAGKHILMEKPMTVDVAEARALAAAAAAAAPERQFFVNNTANFREQCFEARSLVASGALGKIHHVLCVMYSPLLG
jgi:predicted dehydrogenase